MPPLELVLDQLLRLILPSFCAAAAVAALSGMLLKGKLAPLGTVLAMAAGLAAGNWMRGLLPWLPEATWRPEQTGWTWLLAATFLALAAGLLVRLTARVRIVAAALALVTTAAVTYLVVPDYLHSAKWLAPFALVVIANWYFLARAAQRHPSALVPFTWAIVLGGGATLVLLFAHSARFGDLGTLLAATLAGIALPLFRWPNDARPLAPAVATYLPGLMLAGYDSTYSEVPAASFALLAAAPLALALLELPLLKQRGPKVQFVLQCTLLLVPVVIAVVLAMRAEDLGVG